MKMLSRFQKGVAPLMMTALIATWTAPRACATASAHDKAEWSELEGQWSGEARIIVVWAQQKRLPISIAIAPNGDAVGTIGDAALVEGRLKRNRGWLGRKLRVKTDYIIVGRLEGPLIQSEGISRARVKIPFNLIDGAIKGGLHTNGRWFGGASSMRLSAGDLRLKKANDENTDPARRP